MADDLIFTVGETRRIARVVHFDTETAVTNVLATIWTDADAPVVTAAAGGREPTTAATSVEIYYLWDVTAVAAGDYYFQLTYTAGGQTKIEEGRVTVRPTTSKLREYLDEIKREVQESNASEAQQHLSYRDYVSALARAVREFSNVHPRVVKKNLTLTASDWEYALADLAAGVTPTAAWVNGFSTIHPPEPRVDTTVQAIYLVSPLEVEADEEEAVFRFRTHVPSLGDVARVRWTTLHTLSHTVDTISAQYQDAFFLAITQYAAGVALLGPMQAEAARVNDPHIGADMVNYRDLAARRRQAGMDLQKAARAAWKRTEWWL